MSPSTAKLCYSFKLSDAAADWAGAALSDLFPDGLLLAPRSGGVTHLKGWLRAGPPSLKAKALQRLKDLGARGISVHLQQLKAPKALHGRFPALRLGRFHIVPAAQAAKLKTPKLARRITLIQGQAFGTGRHESTRLMLGQLEKVFAQGSVQGALDVGAGSGILGFACLHLGAAQVICVEVESAACAELRENRALNQVKPSRLPVICGAYPLGRLRGRRFKLVLGNLVTPVLEALMPRLASQVAAGGVLLCSGIHSPAEAARVRAAAAKAGLRLAAKAVLKNWFVLRFVKA